jgi:hypothetical protein
MNDAASTQLGTVTRSAAVPCEPGTGRSGTAALVRRSADGAVIADPQEFVVEWALADPVPSPQPRPTSGPRPTASHRRGLHAGARVRRHLVREA